MIDQFGIFKDDESKLTCDTDKFSIKCILVPRASTNQSS